MTHAAPLALTSLTLDVVDPDAEPALVRRAQQRDHAAFAQLYRTHLGRTYALCLRLTADIPRAEELTQKSWITVWEKLPLFRGESAFTTWLHRLAVNTTLAALRAEQRRTARVFGTDISAQALAGTTAAMLLATATKANEADAVGEQLVAVATDLLGRKGVDPAGGLAPGLPLRV